MSNRPAGQDISIGNMHPDQRVPVLILAYNRGREFSRVFDSVLADGPRRIYVFCDGPKGAEDSQAQDEIRSHSEDFPVGFSVYRNFQTSNLGLRAGVIAGIDWIFENEEMAIILEDDIIPNDQFFGFCEDGLNRYRFASNVQQVAGYNGLGSLNRNIFFRRRHLLHSRMDCWGWATWRSRWSDFRSTDVLPNPEVKLTWAPPWTYREIRTGHELAMAGSLDTWDYSWAHHALGKSGLSLVPLANTVDNIGFGPRATNTKSGRSARVHRYGERVKYPNTLKPDLIFVYSDTLARRFERRYRRLTKRLRKYFAWSKSAYRRAASIASRGQV